MDDHDAIREILQLHRQWINQGTDAVKDLQKRVGLLEVKNASLVEKNKLSHLMVGGLGAMVPTLLALALWWMNKA